MPIGNGGIIGPANVPTLLSANGVWSLREAQLAQRQGIWPVIFDPYFEYTTLLLPGNGTNGAQNNTFLDSSSNNFTITRNGNTTQGTFSPFSQTGWGNYFDGTGDYLSIADNAVLRLGTSAFTIECWIYRSASGAAHSIAAKGGATTGWLLEVTSGNLLQFTHGTTTIASTGTVSANTWVHVAAVREGTGSNQFKLYINGTNDGTGTVSTDFTQTETLYVAANRSAGTTMNGYVSNFRLTNGAALYTATFTPATSELTTTSQGASLSQVELLTCQSNRFIDNSTNNFTITPAGNTSVVAFSPFNPTASWSAATYGGSGYFDGSGDYLSVADNAAFDFGSGDFAIQTWIYPTSSLSAVNQTIIDTRPATGTRTSNYALAILTTAQIRFLWADATDIFYNSTASVSQSVWTHVAVTRDGNNLRIFLNGVLDSTFDVTGKSFNASLFNIAYKTYDATSFTYYTGYLSGLQLVKGSPVYTSAFTPPTSPPTNITNTSLLLNFTNAGIYDATSKNDLETVGNAQISTTQSKWGGSSMAFDGTGDWLLIPDQPIQRIGTGNFTIEGWVYRNSSGTYGLIGKGTGTTGWLVSLNSSNQVVFTYGSSTITSTGTVSATTWTHIAVVREGTSTNQTKIYINGTNDGTGTVSTDFNQTNSMYVGADRTGGSAANAYMQDVRVTNYARYVTGTGANAGKMVFNGTNDLALPTAAFPTL